VSQQVCPCGRKATTFCRHCQRGLCERHWALSVDSLTPGIVIVTGCHPRCDSVWWDSANASVEWTPKQGAVRAEAIH
jgi:hypothetical protein